MERKRERGDKSRILFQVTAIDDLDSLVRPEDDDLFLGQVVQDAPVEVHVGGDHKVLGKGKDAEC